MRQRIAQWEQALSDYLAPLMHDVTFVWGAAAGVEFDCGMYIAGASIAMTGFDPAAAFRGRYSTAVGSARALKRYGAGTLADTLSAMFEEKPIGFARRGDLVMHDGGAGVCIGADGLFLPLEGAEPGLVRIPRDLWSKAWAI